MNFFFFYFSVSLTYLHSQISIYKLKFRVTGSQVSPQTTTVIHSNFKNIKCTLDEAPWPESSRDFYLILSCSALSLLFTEYDHIKNNIKLQCPENLLF